MRSRLSAVVGKSQKSAHGDWSLDGTTGLMAEVVPGLRIGAGVVAGHGDSDLYLGGDSRVDAAGGSVIAAYETPEGLRLYGSAFAADLAVDTRRHYQNGAEIDGSNGDTDGVGYGAAVRGGWAFPVDSSTSIMPYTEFQWLRTKLDGYTEQGGAFPAQFSDQTARLLTSRLGFEVDFQVTPTFELQPRVAWGHKLSGDSGDFTATTVGLTQVLNPVRNDSDWAEGAVAAVWRVTGVTMLSAELAGRTGDTADPTVSMTVGLFARF